MLTITITAFPRISPFSTSPIPSPSPIIRDLIKLLMLLILSNPPGRLCKGTSSAYQIAAGIMIKGKILLHLDPNIIRRFFGSGHIPSEPSFCRRSICSKLNCYFTFKYRNGRSHCYSSQLSIAIVHAAVRGRGKMIYFCSSIGLDIATRVQPRTLCPEMLSPTGRLQSIRIKVATMPFSTAVGDPEMHCRFRTKSVFVDMIAASRCVNAFQMRLHVLQFL